MMYALLLKWEMEHDAFTFPVPFRADGDDDARLIAQALFDQCKSHSGYTYLDDAELMSLDDKRYLDFDPWPKKKAVAASV